MDESLGLPAALAASVKHSALYEDAERRAFVSSRNANYDFGVKGPAGKVTKFDQPDVTLHAVLEQYGVPVDMGWKPQ